MLTSILAVVVLVYLLMMLLLRVGLERASQSPRTIDKEPTVSVIVAARNEEHYIGSCIESLMQIDYPLEKLEHIFVDDGSTDRTPEILQQYALRYPSIKVIRALRGKENLLGKANALAQGIEISRGEVLMFTDADCIAHKNWVRKTVTYFRPGVGIVGGFTLLEARNIFEGMQSLDWIFLFGLASATAGLRIPLTVIGNNFAVLRAAYEEVGGFRRIPFSVTEDYALVQSVVAKTRYKVAFPLDPETLVHSRACKDLLQLFRQKQRWGVGGLDMVLRGMLIMSVGWSLRVVFLVAPFLTQPSVFLVSLLAMMFIDFRFLFKPLKTFGAISYLKYFVFFELYYLIYVTILPFVAVLSRKIVWKERSL